MMIAFCVFIALLIGAFWVCFEQAHKISELETKIKNLENKDPFAPKWRDYE